MKKEMNLLNGNVIKVLAILSLPMIAANFAQTALGLIDMYWVGTLGSGAVSAVGTASFYLNLATAVATLITVGTGVKYAQHLGAGNKEKANKYFSSSIIITLIISTLYFTVIYIFSGELISFYGISDVEVVEKSIGYLKASLFGTPFLFMSLTLTALLTSKGKTKSIFISNVVALVINSILDPIFIYGFRNVIPSMGVVGAAWATNIARLVTFFILAYSIRHDFKESFSLDFTSKETITTLKLGIPVATQRIIFIFISMYLAKIIAQFGTEAIAAQKIGLQIESITYVTIGGLQGSLVAFIGQNYGARKFERVKEGYNKALLLAIGFSAATTILFLLFPRQLVGIFIDEKEVIEVGVGYMQAIGISQMFMCMEYITVGVFNGIGKTYVPPIVSIVFTALRIPLALLLIKPLGVNGIWWSISISSIIKGLVLFVWIKMTLRKEEYSNELQVSN